MELMEASVYVGDGALEVRDVPVPEPGPGEVLIEIAQCGICGTDLHFVLERIARPGSVLGHEWSGTIAAVGPDVEGWSVGARVVCGPEPGCGECRACVRGRPSVCLRRPPVDHLSFRGAFARYVVAPAEQLLAVPDDLPSRAAALTEPTAVAMHAVTLSGATPADRVLVTGGGPVGLLVTAVLHARGIDDVTVSEPAPARRERALQVGAARVVTPDELPTPSMGSPVPEPFTVVFECSDYDADGFAAALALLASGAMPLDALVEPVDVFLDELLPVMQRCAAGELPGKVMVRPRRSGES
jgi:threonine dehydrogenase-like Zn-dependent dehydrogenase